MYQQQPQTTAPKPNPVETLRTIDKQHVYDVHDKIMIKLQ